MNKKNKVLISAAGMLVLTAAAASASTFAWFTTVRNATINYSSANVYSSSSSLSISYVSSLNRFIASNEAGLDDDQHVSVTGVHRITDISGNGTKFYKPIWNSSDTDSSIADSIITIPTVGEGAADGYYVDFTIRVSQSATATGDMKVYVGKNTTITAHTPDDPQDEAAAKCARIAILDEAKAPIFIWTPDGNDGINNYTYVSTVADAIPGNVETSWKTQAGYTANIQTPAFDDTDNFHAGDLPASNFTTNELAAAAFVKPIVTLYGTDAATPDYSDDITIRAWIEGEDKECENVSVDGGALGGVFDFSIDLYGLGVI